MQVDIAYVSVVIIVLPVFFLGGSIWIGIGLFLTAVLLTLFPDKTLFRPSMMIGKQPFSMY